MAEEILASAVLLAPIYKFCFFLLHLSSLLSNHSPVNFSLGNVNLVIHLVLCFVILLPK